MKNKERKERFLYEDSMLFKLETEKRKFCIQKLSVEQRCTFIKAYKKKQKVPDC